MSDPLDVELRFQIQRAQPELLMPQAVLSRTGEHLAVKYTGVFSPQTVERYVFESYTALRRTAKVHTHPVADHPHYLGTRVRQLLRELTTVPA
nr:hypothetical protein [Rhodococcus wratislaviensis]GLK37791.1 hypothetical protein GCM10017611_46560 [Rhodococcus wratislaviensis]